VLLEIEFEDAGDSMHNSRSLFFLYDFAKGDLRSCGLERVLDVPGAVVTSGLEVGLAEPGRARSVLKITFRLAPLLPVPAFAPGSTMPTHQPRPVLPLRIA
jgi:hypothetical protein